MSRWLPSQRRWSMFFRYFSKSGLFVFLYDSFRWCSPCIFWSAPLSSSTSWLPWCPTPTRGSSSNQTWSGSLDIQNLSREFQHFWKEFNYNFVKGIWARQIWPLRPLTSLRHGCPDFKNVAVGQKSPKLRTTPNFQMMIINMRMEKLMDFCQSLTLGFLRGRSPKQASEIQKALKMSRIGVELSKNITPLSGAGINFFFLYIWSLN